jgi:UDP-N-acetylmuramate: L-alanyl-gamma-D-glutamyl-meso-diaminopimelate ligase
MHVHLIGVSGTGMGSLAGLLKKAGHHVSGSDTAFYPPMGDALVRWGVATKTGYSAANLEPRPDLVVVGNVCRKDNPEARAAIDGGLRYVSFPQLIEEMFVANRPGFVIAGTHGKTTTTSLVAWLLAATGRDPGFLVGGIPKNFTESFALGGASSPFVIEGDEYDSAFFEKSPKFWRYKPWAAVLTSVEQDHIDIYPTMESYRAAFEGFVDRIPADGLLVGFGGDAEVRRLAKRATSRVRYYALTKDDTGDVLAEWQGAVVAPQHGAQPFDLYIGGTSAGRVLSPLAGEHNLRNTLAALAIVTEGADVPLREAITALGQFQGVRRRQDLVGVADGVNVYDDFAHHPTAVDETLRAIRSRHNSGALYAVFEPRSATASRNLHQGDYPAAFRAADVTLLAPVGRADIAESERLDVSKIVADINAQGGRAELPGSVDAIVQFLAADTKAGDTVLIMSNGGFGGIHEKLLTALTQRRIRANIAGE